MAGLNDYSEFDVARQRVKQTESANLQTQKDAIARRAAQLGGGPSGAMIKQERLAEDESAKRTEGALGTVDAAQRAEQRRVKEIEDTRGFQRSEREAVQGFSRAEREAMQGFSRAEREAAQGFSAEEAQKARDLQSSQFAKQLELSKEQFDWDKHIDEVNQALADRVQENNEKPGALEKLFSASTYTGGLSNLGKTGLVAGVAGVGGAATGAILGEAAGGKIICTEYCRLGWLPREILEADLLYQAKYASVDVIKNYLAWAQYVVPMVRDSVVARYLYWPIAKSWAYQMAWKMGVIKKKPLLGFLFETVFLAISNFIGSRIRSYKKAKRGAACI